MVSFNRLIYRKNKIEQNFDAFCLHMILLKECHMYLALAVLLVSGYESSGQIC